MERVFPVEAAGTYTSSPLKTKGLSRGSREGIVAKILQPGLFLVALEGGGKIEVRSSEALKAGNRVRVSFAPDAETRRPSGPDSSVVHREAVSQWTAFIPLAFGGRDGKAKLEIFVDRRPGSRPDQGPTAAYFIFTVSTEKNGETQWSVHLRGRQVALQVYSPRGNRESLKALMEDVERALEARGLTLSGKAVFLDRPFRVPAGFRLNVTG